MYRAVLTLQTLTLLEDTPAHKSGTAIMQQSQTMGQEELSFFPVPCLASTAPSLPPCVSPGPHPALESGRAAPLQSWSSGCRCLRQ